MGVLGSILLLFSFCSSIGKSRKVERVKYEVAEGADLIPHIISLKNGAWIRELWTFPYIELVLILSYFSFML